MLEQARPSRKRRVLRTIVVQLAIAAVTIMALEFALRWLRPQPLGFSAYNEDGLLLHLPGRSAVYRAFDVEAHVRINSQGFRDDEFAVPKPTDTVRILAVGDSLTEAMQVEHEETFASILEESLAGGAHRVEVLNLGVSGSGTSDQLAMLRAFAPRLQPDLVIVFFCIANDLANNALQGPCRLTDASLECTPPEPPSPGRLAFMRLKAELSTHLHLYQVIRAASSASFFRRIGLRPPVYEDMTATPFAIELYLEPEPAYITQSRVLTRELLRELRDLDASFGAKTWLVLIPIGEQIDDAEWAAVERKRPGLVRDRPQRAMREVGEEAGLPVLDLYEPFRARAERGERLYWRIDTHLNPRGHETVAASVLEALRRDGNVLVPQREAGDSATASKQR